MPNPKTDCFCGQTWKPERIYRIAHSAGWDAGNRSMKDGGRRKWSRKDYNAAADAFRKVVESLSPVH